MRDLILKPFSTTRGEAKFKFILMVVIIIGIVYVVIKAAPVWIDYYSLKDEVEQLALNNPCRKEAMDKIKQIIMDRLKEFEKTTVKEKDVIVKCENDRMMIRVSYQRRLDLPGYSNTFNFNIDEEVRKF